MIVKCYFYIYLLYNVYLIKFLWQHMFNLFIVVNLYLINHYLNDRLNLINNEQSLFHHQHSYGIKYTVHYWWLSKTSLHSWCISTFLCIKYQTCEHLSSIGRRSCEILMKEKTPSSHPCHTKLCAFSCLISRPQILNPRSRDQIRGK